MNADSFFNRFIYITVFVIFGLLVRKAADKQTTPWVKTLSRIIVLAVYAIGYYFASNIRYLCKRS